MVRGYGRFANRPFQMVVRRNEGMGPRTREYKRERRVTVVWMTDIFEVNR